MDIQSLNFELLKAFIGWCYSKDLKPQLVVKYFENIGVDKSYFENNTIVLNIGQNSIIDLLMEDNVISFKSRFNQVSHSLAIPIEHIITCFPREIQGLNLALYAIVTSVDSHNKETNKEKPKLSLVTKDRVDNNKKGDNNEICN